jgi:hypothetical protein
LTHFTKGHVIRSKRSEDQWEVRLPLNFTSSGLERKAVGEDTKDILWTTSISFTPVFEGMIRVGFDNQTHPDLVTVQSVYDGNIPMGFVLESGASTTLSTAPSIESSIHVPTTVKLSQNTVIDCAWIPARATFISDNPRIALIDQHNLSIVPKRLGTFSVKLMQATPGADSMPKILATWTVKVVPS